MARIEIPAGEGTERERMWAMVPAVESAREVFRDAVHDQSSLPEREREVARMRIAQINACDI